MEIISDRISYVQDDNGLSIVISSLADRKKARAAGIILLMWLTGGAIMVYGYPSLQEQKTKLVVIIWAAFWLYFLYVLSRLWRWKKYGHEIIKINDGKLKYKKDVKGRGWVLDFETEKVKDFRVSTSEEPGWVKRIGGEFWNTDCDSMRFNYEDREVSLGFMLSEKETGRLLEILGTHVHLAGPQSNRQKKEEEWKTKSTQ